MYNLGKIRFSIILMYFFMIFSSYSFAGPIEDLYKDLTVLDKTSQTSRKSYTAIGDKFYKIYVNNPSGKSADEALLGAARSYRRAYERFKIQMDLDKSLNYYRMVQGAFTSASARTSYLESADIFIKKKDSASAKFILNKLIQKHPQSNEAAVAKKRMSTLTPSKAASSITKQTKPQVKEEPKPKQVSTQTEVSAGKTSGATASGKPVNIHGIRYFSDKNYTRIVVDLSNNAEYSSHWLKADTSLHKPPRLTIDINNSSLDAKAPRNMSIKDGLLTAVRIGYHANEKRTRIVLDSENVKDFTVFQMSNPSRIVVDVFSDEREDSPRRPVIASGQQSSLQTAQNVPIKDDVKAAVIEKEREVERDRKKAEETKKIAENPMTKPKTAQDLSKDITLGAALGLKIKTIVIDPGHGGKDPGAISNGIKEKDIVLDISKQLYEYLKKHSELNVHMTRTTDKFIPLEERTAIANKLKADILISVHANAAKNTGASGLETYVFNVTNDKAALEVAALENQATTKSISDLQGILKDILRYSKLEESVSLATSVQGMLVKNVKAAKKQNLGVKQAPFYVLVGATMPAILIETGFITNKEDSEKLKNASYRKKLAKGIYEGIKEYIEKYNNY